MEQRPNPETLLQRAQLEERQKKRGQLKIYLGAAPGVGKTYKMLQDAIAQRAQGLDVVVGVVEAHGRQEIKSLLTQLEILPEQLVDYRNIKLHEFDLDLALKRQPALILMDEMAHTNAPGLRHTKRWQDIKELLDRGIDVYTTLNVQHIESLIDDVSQVIHTAIKETVPDFMVEMADTIELIDLPPEDLLKRLKEGKIYIPAQAELAADIFFRKGNLIALRELALRTTAERVGAQVFLYRQNQGIKHIWPTKEKILVCVGPGAESCKLIRAAKRIATSLQVAWIAVYVDAPRFKSAEEKRNLAIKNLQLAAQLGAETYILTGFDLVKEIMHFAREQNVTQIMIWKHIRNRWQDIFFRSLANEIVRHSEEIDVYIMTGERQRMPEKAIPNKQAVPWRIYIISIAIVALTTVINYLLYPFLSGSDLAMMYLLSITIIALFGRFGPSLLGSILSVLAYAFFFIPPYDSLVIAGPRSFLTLLIMLLIAQVISQLTILTRRQTEIAQQIERQTSALYVLSRQLANTRGVDKLLETGIQYLADLFDSEVLALLPHNGHLVIQARCRTNQLLNDKEQGVAQWVYELGQIAGLGTDTLSFSDALYVPLLGSRGSLGVLRLRPINAERLISPEQIQLLKNCANQLALALEVDRLL
ncbi:MAG TPA: DUF4118 domain-containing protein [Gammaproteobacteria bacterium]|jgi:two-component system sensor histidine kinase KdpD|nr:DUF4118 domain-containing protein [Gammaproteobacteria bacterium]